MVALILFNSSDNSLLSDTFEFDQKEFIIFYEDTTARNYEMDLTISQQKLSFIMQSPFVRDIWES